MLIWALIGLSAWIIVGLILALIVGRAARLGEPSQESLVLDCLSAGMTVEEIVAQYPTDDAAEVRAIAAYERLLARKEP